MRIKKTVAANYCFYFASFDKEQLEVVIVSLVENRPLSNIIVVREATS